MSEYHAQFKAPKTKRSLVHFFVYPIVFLTALIVGLILGAAASTTTPDAGSNPSFSRPTLNSTPSPAVKKPAPTKAKPATFSDGTRKVGVDVESGEYKTNGDDFCYWARLRDLDGSLGSIITNHLGNGPQTVTIKKTDTAFESRGCGEWVKV